MNKESLQNISIIIYLQQYPFLNYISFQGRQLIDSHTNY